MTLGRIGEYLLEYLVVTLILIAAAATVLFFCPVICGVTAYFQKDAETRRFKDIFLSIGENWKILIFYSIFQLVILVFPVLNIYYFNFHPAKMNVAIYAVSYVVLVFGALFLMTMPTVIVNMRVNPLQLIFNGITLLFGGFWRSLAGVVAVGGIVALVLYFPYPIPPLLYFVFLAVSKLMQENITVLKAKVLGTTVEELKREQKPVDDYIDEFGKIKSDPVKEKEVEDNDEEN